MGLPLAGGGIGAVVVALIVMFLGGDPNEVLQQAGPQQPGGQTSTLSPDDPARVFMEQLLADTEDTWNPIFREQLGREYEEPKLVIFDRATPTACGTGQSAMGPFYCPLDRAVYIDLDFYRQLKERFAAPGDFAQAYVIAHEVGHHVQTLLGISEQVHAARQRSGETEGNALSVRQELQADCFAGVWANHANRTRNILEAGDVEEGLRAASAIGDDKIQQQSQGYIVPESFTHGSSAQRVEWFRRGLESGRVQACDTFAQ